MNLAAGDRSSYRRPPEERPGVFLMIDSLQTGGSERQYAALASTLDRESFRLDLGCIQDKGGFREGLGEITRFRLGGSLTSAHSFKTRFRLGRHLRARDIAVAHAFDFYTNVTLIPVARLARVPVIIASQRQLGDLLSPAQTRAQDLAFRWCDRIVCNSNAAAEALAGRGFARAKLVVVPNGLPPEAFESAVPALPQRPGTIRIGMIARMSVRSKNHLGLLRAMASLRGRFPNIELVLVGDGSLRTEIEQEAARLGFGESVRFLGDRRDIAACLASVDISVLPSLSESLSNVVLESMAAGVAVIATQVGDHAAILAGGRGIAIPAGDNEVLAAAIARMIEDPDLRERSAREARRYVHENFSLDVMRRRYEELYVELLVQKGWRPRPASAQHRTPNRALRVAVVAPSLRYVGGQSVQADQLVRLWWNDPDVRAWLIPVDPVFPPGLRWVERVPVLRTLLREPFYLAALWRGLRDADVAHIFSASYWSFLLAPAPALKVAHWRGKKALINYHSGEARDHLARFPSARRILRTADRLATPSKFLVNVFRDFGLDADSVPNVVDLGEFRFRERRPIGPRLVCTRGFHRYYSVDLVVTAFAAVTKVFPDATLCLVGQGPAEAEIRALVERLGLSGVTFAGVAPRRDIARFYDAADIFINASWLDNMPISILEAFASGTPVVSTAPEGICYVVEHERTGLLSATGDAEALAQNVLRVLADPELAERLARNAVMECRRYEWSAVRGQWLEVYRTLVSPATVLNNAGSGGGAESSPHPSTAQRDDTNDRQLAAREPIHKT